MRVGFSGRPSSLPGVFAPSPRERMARYVSACSELGLGCLELPAGVLFGKSGWRNQFLAACTEASSAQAGAGRSRAGVDVLVRVRPSDCFGVRAPSHEGRDRTETGYARHLVRLVGGRLATVLMRSEHSISTSDVSPPEGQGAARIGLVIGWSDQAAILAAARATRRSSQFAMLPLLSLGSEHGSRLERTVERALGVCRNENRGGDMYLFLSMPRSGRPSASASTRDTGALLEAVRRFEEETASEIGVIFSGPGGEAHAHQAADIARELQSPRVIGRAGPLVPRLGSTVRIRDVELGLDMQYAIVSPEQASVMAGRLSSESPVARAIMGQPCGARVEVAAPDGRVVYELLEVMN
ncbi:MAG: Transcription elongation factor GreA [Firmicutes bacterium ADurb.BinA052]|nr:MAG: Transcription elongation factor GreA [Firmicutes bacterium ADurb.BinA052]